jgi:ATP-dependent RNA helicase SUPV3L1/SUV3
MLATSPDPRSLPNPRHINRVPPHLNAEQIGRIRQAAFNLPQVVKPADFIPENTPEFEDYLDGQGLILLQKAVAGARPSRWIAPELMDAALLHLDAMGGGREVRSVMTERGAALESLGLFRKGNGWERLLTQTLALPSQGWKLAVSYRVAIDAAQVWDYYRLGDKPALIKSLGTPPAYEHATALLTHLQALVDRAVVSNPRQMASAQGGLHARAGALGAPRGRTRHPGRPERSTGV